MAKPTLGKSGRAVKSRANQKHAELPSFSKVFTGRGDGTWAPHLDSTMANSLRERKKAGGKRAAPVAEDTKKDEDQSPDLEPNLYIAISIMLIFAFFVGLLLYCKVDRRNIGPLAYRKIDINGLFRILDDY